MYDDLCKFGYKTLNEILEENNIPRSQIKSIRKYTDFLDKESAYYPKARKEVNFYSKETAQKIIEFANLSKGDKCKRINLLLYGVENVSQLEDVRKNVSEKNKANSEEREIKRNKTNMERYGTCDFINSDKAKQTIINNYGNIKNYNIEMGKKKKERFNTKFEKFCKENDCSVFAQVFDFNRHAYKLTVEVAEINDIKFIEYMNTRFIKNSDVIKLNYLLNNLTCSHTSIGEKQIVDFVKSLGVETIENDRKIIYPKELDIYIPSKKVAIEFDGLYFHSTALQKDKNYHLNKTIACEEKGIRLIHIFEDEWLNRRQIIESIIKSSLGIYDRQIYADDCDIKSISKNEFDDFCNKNSMKIYNSSENLGLFYKNELVQVIGFSNLEFNENELNCIVRKLNVEIINGFTKLINYYGKNCISYVDRRLFNINEYKKIGFEFIKESEPNYFYIKNQEKFDYDNIIKKFLNAFEPNLTEEQNMEKLGYYRIYDCGTIKVKWSVK